MLCERAPIAGDTVELQLCAQTGNPFMLKIHAGTSSSASYTASGCWRLSRGSTRRSLEAAGMGADDGVGNGSSAACSAVILAAGRSRVVACSRTLATSASHGPMRALAASTSSLSPDDLSVAA